MKRRGIIFTSILICLVFIFSFASAFTLPQQQIVQGPNYETTCNGNVCNTIIYSYEKYFLRNSVWEQIDESFHDCSHDGKTQFCTNDYYYNVIADDGGLVSSFINSKNYSVQMQNFSDTQLNFNPSIYGSVLTYQNIIPNVDLKYQYLPTKLKEEIIINQPLQSLPENDFNITFAKFGDADFNVDESSICDSNYVCEEIPTIATKDEINLQIPINFFSRNEIAYPITIDPTLILNGTNITWNGYVTNTSNATSSSYVRTSNPIDYLSSGYIPDVIPGETKHARAEMDFNTVAIPNSADLRKLQVQIYLETSSVNGTNVTLTLNHMEKNSSQYADVTTLCQGNCQFYKDMGNGSAYSSATYVSKQNVLLNFSSQGMTDFRNSFSSNWFGLGFAGNYLPTSEVKIGSRDNSNSSRRPKLIVTYSIEEYNVTWDANGNMKQGLGKYLEYDSWHRVSKIRQNNATGNILEEYLYDQDGNRLKKIEYRGGNISNNETTYYFNSRPVDFIQVRNASGIFNFSYYYMNDKLVAMKGPTGKMLYYHGDHLGSTTLVTNQSGDVVENDVYLPYGGIYSGAASSKYLFTGKERDDGTGFDYFGARYYSSQFMHFLQPDKIKNIYDPQNLNSYAYTLNNPYKYIDKDGNFVWVPLAIGGVAGIADFSYQYYHNGQSFNNALAHGTTVGVATTAALYAPILIASGALATTAGFAITMSGSMIQQKIENPGISVQNALPVATTNGLIDLAIPKFLSDANTPGIVNYGRDKILSAGTFSQTMQNKLFSDLIIEGTSEIADTGANYLLSGGSMNIKTLINTEISNQKVSKPQTNKPSFSGNSRSSESGTMWQSNGLDGKCGVIMSCSGGKHR